MNLEPELVERMVKLVREISNPKASDRTQSYVYDIPIKDIGRMRSEAREIAKLLPDPDSDKARELAKMAYRYTDNGSGELVDAGLVELALAAIKWGREQGK